MAVTSSNEIMSASTCARESHTSTSNPINQEEDEDQPPAAPHPVPQQAAIQPRQVPAQLLAVTIQRLAAQVQAIILLTPIIQAPQPAAALLPAAILALLLQAPLIPPRLAAVTQAPVLRKILRQQVLQRPPRLALRTLPLPVLPKLLAPVMTTSIDIRR